MSNSVKSQDDTTSKTRKRSLPTWMSSRETKNKSDGKKPKDEEREEGDKQPNLSKGHTKKNTGNGPSEELRHGKDSAASSSSTTDFSKLMDGVVFVLSGFVNPERSTLRSQALAMGATFQPDWNSDCTLLVCAFLNTPKFRQVAADCGTIVSKEWIMECYSQKKLVDIEQYLMHAGKPWRKSNSSHVSQDKKELPPTKSQKQVNTRSESKFTASSSSKSSASFTPDNERFSLSEVRKWASDDLARTISWLQSQEEKPEPSEIKQIAAEGILTCLQDAIDSLEQNQDARSITEQWNFVPRAVEELTKIENSKKESASVSRQELCIRAKAWKQIYKEELKKTENNYNKSSTRNKKPESEEKGKTGRNASATGDATGYDSDETMEMTEEEIELAYRNVASKSC